VLQFYFLSISTLLIGSLSLVFAASEDSSHSFRRFIAARTVRITVGILAALVGILKFFVRAPGDTVVVVGDLLPAAAGIALGLALLSGSLGRQVEENEPLKKVQSMSRYYRIPLGVVGIAAALAHFFVPEAVIL
jgi:hypothetical protein